MNKMNDWRTWVGPKNDKILKNQYVTHFSISVIWRNFIMFSKGGYKFVFEI